MTKQFLFSLASRFSFLVTLVFSSSASSFYKNEQDSSDLVEKSPLVPSVGINIPENIYRSLEQKSEIFSKKIDQLRIQHKKNPALLQLIPDVEVFHKAIDWGLRHKNFY